MTTLLSDIFVATDLERALADRLVVARRHPSEALTILNYSDRCQYERGLWSPVTTQCRGLIHDDQGRVVARPFRKFFNHNQSEAPAFDPSAPCIVTDKLDGSLGILYRRQIGYAIATRGSFDSEQARHATALLAERYATWQVPVGWTPLFEIVYQMNRIVVDYGERDDIILLGAVEIASGRTVGPLHPILSSWPGPRATQFAYATVADALAAAPRVGAEGLVIHLLDSDERVKVKQDDYVALHRIVTGLNERAVWQHAMEGKPLSELLAALPEEFRGWTSEVAARLLATVDAAAAEVERTYAAILDTLPDGCSRKDFALAANGSALRPLLFARHDGKDYRSRLWKDAKPSPRLGPRGLAPSDDTA